MEMPEDPFSEHETSLLANAFVMEMLLREDRAMRDDAPPHAVTQAPGAKLTPEMIRKALEDLWSPRLRPPFPC